MLQASSREENGEVVFRSRLEYLGSVVIELCNSGQQRSPERNEFGSFTHF